MALVDRIPGDMMLFAYWRAIRSALPNYSDETIIKRFLKDFGTYCEDCTTAALSDRIRRMNALWMEEQKTK